jgi:hypothetical protein
VQMPTRSAQRPSIHAVRLVALLSTQLATAAHAQAMGHGLISYATPIILFLGVAAVVTALVGAVFRPEIVRSAIWAAVVLVIIFFILRNTAGLTSAISVG